MAEDDEEPQAVVGVAPVTLVLELTDPGGEMLSSSRQTIPEEVKRYQSIPGGIQIIAQVSLNLRKYGKYVARATLAGRTSSGQFSVSRAKSIWVMNPETDPPAGS